MVFYYEHLYSLYTKANMSLFVIFLTLEHSVVTRKIFKFKTMIIEQIVFFSFENSLVFYTERKKADQMTAMSCRTLEVIVIRLYLCPDTDVRQPYKRLQWQCYF
jgi:hypothetical protein